MTSLRILLAEDHPCTNRVLTQLLEKRGHSVAQAITVRDALETARSKQFDVAIIDLGLPDGNGWNLLRSLRQLIPGIQGIAMSGFGQKSDKQQSAAAGFIAHLTKPVESCTLDAELQRCAEARWT